MLNIYELVARAEKLAPTIKPENRANYNELMQKLHEVVVEENKRQTVYIMAAFMIGMLETFPIVEE